VRAVTRDSLGAWLIKASGRSPATREHLRSRFAELTTRCVRPSYRTELLEPGQRVLLWVSGDDPDHPPGLYAHGWTTGRAVPDVASPGALVVPVRLEPLASPVLRSELRLHPELSAIEVLRMPAGSNPSYLTRDELDALRGQWPEVCEG
jgi:hypothetical protein